jgi:hypothetical protein
MDSAKAAELRLTGWTLGKLQQETDDALAALGLAAHVVTAIRAASRPEIPLESLMQVLSRSLSACIFSQGHTRKRPRSLTGPARGRPRNSKPPDQRRLPRSME